MSMQSIKDKAESHGLPDVDIEKMLQRIRESVVHHSASVAYKHSNYFMEWERRDSPEVVPRNPIISDIRQSGTSARTME